MSGQTRIVHSESKPAWNIVGTKLGGKYKRAIIPYVESTDNEVTEINKQEALNDAMFINICFNAKPTLDLIKMIK